MERRGFTLVELLISTMLISVVATELAVVCSGLFRIQKMRMLDTEFQNRLRATRELMLFHAVEQTGDRSYGGLLSATNIVNAGEQVAAYFQWAERDKMAEFDTTRKNLMPRFVVQGIDDGRRAITTTSNMQVTNDLLFVSVAADLNVDRRKETRQERIAVPVFGRERSTDNPWDEFMYVGPGGVVWK